MDIIDFYRMEQKRVHNWMRRSIRDLTLEEWMRFHLIHARHHARQIRQRIGR